MDDCCVGRPRAFVAWITRERCGRRIEGGTCRDACGDGGPAHPVHARYRSPFRIRSKASTLPIASWTGLWSCGVMRSRFHAWLFQNSPTSPA